MKKKDSKNIVKIVAVAMVIVVVIALIATCSGDKSGYVASDSVLASGDEWVYYNDTMQNIWRKSVDGGEPMLFAENLTVLSASGNEVLTTDGNNFILVDDDGNVLDRVEGITVAGAYLTSDAIYYKHIDSKYIVRMDRETKEVKDVVPVAVDKFMAYEHQIVFTTDNKMVFFYDTQTGIPMGYFGEKQIGDFDVYNDYLVYSDLNEGGRVTMMQLSTGEETEVKGVKTKKLTYTNDKIFYLENARGGKKRFELKEIELSDNN